MGDQRLGSAFSWTAARGTRAARSAAAKLGNAALSRLEKLFSRGVKICVTVADQSDGLDRAGTKANIDFLVNAVGAENISGIESANEYSNPATRPADWATQLRDFHKWLYKTVRSKAALNTVPVIGPSIWGRLTQDYVTLGNLEPNIDRGCLHWYTGGRRPTRAGMPGKPAGLSPIRWPTRSAKPRCWRRPSRCGSPNTGYPVAGPGTPLSQLHHQRKGRRRNMSFGACSTRFGEGVEKMNIYALIDDVHRDPPRYHGLTRRDAQAPAEPSTR